MNSSIWIVYNEGFTEIFGYFSDVIFLYPPNNEHAHEMTIKHAYFSISHGQGEKYHSLFDYFFLSFFVLVRSFSFICFQYIYERNKLLCVVIHATKRYQLKTQLKSNRFLVSTIPAAVLLIWMFLDCMWLCYTLS